MGLPILRKSEKLKPLNTIEETLQPSVEELGKWKHKGLTIAASLINIAEIPLMVSCIPVVCIFTAISAAGALNSMIMAMNFSLLSIFLVSAICLLPGLAIPLLVSLFNQHLLARAAGKYYPLFARRLGQTSIVWLVTAILGFIYFSLTTGTEVVLSFICLAVASGYLTQLFISRRVVRRQLGKDMKAATFVQKGPPLRLENHVMARLTEKLEAMEYATTHFEFQKLANECLILMPNRPAPPPPYQTPEFEVAHLLVDTLMQANMTGEADRVSSRMMYFADKD